MAFLREISVRGLFGLYDHSLTLRKDPPVTIVAGPNGIGKTTLLALTTALLQGSYKRLIRTQFERLTVVSSSGKALTVEPLETATEEHVTPLYLSLSERGRQVATQTIYVASPVAFPSHVERMGDSYFDQHHGDVVSASEIAARYGISPHKRDPIPVNQPEWMAPDDWRVDFIETKRLDSLLMRSKTRARGEAVNAPIHIYLDAVRDAMDVARRESFRINQRRDRTFARRLLSRARVTVRPDALRTRYSEVEKRASTLTANGLLADSLDVLPDGRLNPTEKRLLKLFLDDFEAKMQPLEPISSRLEKLRTVVGSKFLNKTLDIDPRRGLVFYSNNQREEIDADALSSGEQHEIALLSRLLFREEEGTTVLIDEPELSLHVSWQHTMVDDLTEIASLVGLSFVIATHSTAIINGRWDLVEELGPIDDSVAKADGS